MDTLKWKEKFLYYIGFIKIFIKSKFKKKQ